MRNIKDIINFVDTIPDMLGRLFMPVDRVDFVSDIKTIISQWREYKDLEEQGKLLKLPISPKTPIYSIEYCCGKNSNNKAGLCYKGRCEECESKSYYILEETAESSCKIFEIGKSVFPTKESAEAALKEMGE